MLRGLSIRDMLLIERLELEFQPGLNVLTGETGAGKSILLDSLGFVLGWRGRGDVVREGADRAEVEAVFELAADHPARKVLNDAGLPEEDALVLRRSATRDGRKQAWVNDRRCAAQTLKSLAECLVEIHGQHDDRGLLNPRGHRALLDEYADAAGLLAATRSAWQGLREARARLAERQAHLEKVARDREYLEFAVDELDRLAPEAGEDDALDARRRLMQAAARIRDDIAKAAQVMGREGAEGALVDAARWLGAVEDRAEGRLEEPLAALSRALEELDTAQRGVADCLEALDFNPVELEQVEERLFAIRALARKHGVQPDDLPALHDDLRHRLNEIDEGAGQIAELEKAVKAARQKYEQAARKLSDKRHKAAARLDKAMRAELAPLKMERAVFRTELSPAEPGPDGHDAVQFTVATNPGAPAGPLDKIASGGELSRFLLALRVCLSAGDAGLTMIFDEIDRGVGGATADAVGRRLAALAEGGQVLVVTHSPQVAARAAHHWRVVKTVKGGKTLSDVHPVSDKARIDEIARMLAGENLTDEARAAARALLRG